MLSLDPPSLGRRSRIKKKAGTEREVGARATEPCSAHGPRPGTRSERGDGDPHALNACAMIWSARDGCMRCVISSSPCARRCGSLNMPRES